MDVGGVDRLLGNLAKDPRVRGQQFEHVCKWFLANDPLYKRRLRRVWLWKEWPDRPGDVEAGIDLVAEDVDGHLWAVQAKAYAEFSPIPKSELNKFLSESNTRQFAQRLLISTTVGGLHHLAQRAVAAQDKPVAVVDLTDLRAADAHLDWPESPTDLRPPRPLLPASPRDYQRDALRDVTTGFQSTDRGQLIMACGTGKTLTSLFVQEELSAERTLILVPSLSLLKQTLRVWMANANRDFDILPVCSDASVSRDDDAVVAHTTDLGVPVTTDPSDIARFLRRRGPRVVFATYQSSPQVAAAFAEPRVPAFDLVLADEAHRCAGPVSSDFATILDPGRIRARRRLFMTATPRYFTGRVLKAARDADFEYASMDDASTFGPVLHQLRFGAAIERGLLTDYRLFVVGVDDRTYREWADRGALVRTDGDDVTDAATLAAQIGLAKAIREYGLRRTISFHSRVKRAREFAAGLPKTIAWMPAAQRPEGDPWCEYTSGEMNAGERGRLIQRLAAIEDGQYGLLTNARCLAEGVDVPTLDAVAFIDPRRSEVDIVQAVGRAIRKSDDKKIGTIVIPVFVDTESDPEAVLNSSTFKTVWDVVRALRAHDEELGRQLDAVRRAIGRRNGRPQLPDKIHIDIPRSVDGAFAEAFTIRLVEQSTATWEFYYGVLETYADREGHARVPQSFEADGVRLGSWVARQRRQEALDGLGAERRGLLELLPGWSWDARSDRWQDSFDLLVDYVDEHANARVPQSFKTSGGVKLGLWVGVQRGLYAEGLLDRDKQRLLENLDGWSWNAREENWADGYRHLLGYVAVHEDAAPPKSAVFNGFPLGPWVSRQRVWRVKGTLSQERQDRLSALPGWVWDPSTAAWDEGFGHLSTYLRENGGASVPQSLVVDRYRLGAWTSQQRLLYGKGKLSADRRGRLEELPGWMWTAEDDDARWMEFLGQLESYIAAHGDAMVPQNFVRGGYRLGQWVTTQRTAYAAATLMPKRQRLLSELPGWAWQAREERWERNYRLLLQYAREHGNARVPQSHWVDGVKLGTWIGEQRMAFAHGKMSEERRARLEAVAGWTWSPRDEKWKLGYERIETYIRQHGHARVPVAYVDDDGYQLGTWVANQRRKRTRNDLSDDRIARLDTLPGWMWKAR